MYQVRGVFRTNTQHLSIWQFIIFFKSSEDVAQFFKGSLS